MPRVLTARAVADLVAPALTAESSGPAYGRLTEALRHLIADGRLPEGSRLPSERDLPGPLGLSRTTVTRAYTELRAQGYLHTRRGSGSVVQVPDVPGGRIDHLLTPSALSDGAIDLTCTAAGAPGGTSEAYGQALEELGAYLPGTGYYPGGVPVLREVVAERFTARGLATTPDQVIVAPGALAGVAIAARALLAPRGRVLVETPTYPNAIATLVGAGARTVAHPIEHAQDDWDVAGLGRTLRQSGARAAYLIPDFHNPTGALMPAGQRAEIGRMLRAAGVVPIIDESIVDLPLDGQVVPEPLGRHVPDAITVGSVSKSLWGGLRVGWLRVPRGRAADMAASRLKLDLGCRFWNSSSPHGCCRRRPRFFRSSRPGSGRAATSCWPGCASTCPTGGCGCRAAAWRCGAPCRARDRPRWRPRRGPMMSRSPPAPTSPRAAGSTAGSGCPTCSATTSSSRSHRGSRKPGPTCWRAGSALAGTTGADLSRSSAASSPDQPPPSAASGCPTPHRAPPVVAPAPTERRQWSSRARPGSRDRLVVLDKGSARRVAGTARASVHDGPMREANPCHPSSPTVSSSRSPARCMS
ncbi:PLP-dependent aminotransferase family protein [Serinicoccus marinus]|uniref:aminotransferase-like domain-containing protein n=1 Tax=Serinicoccus marinus TaxID=247333 RepID=UPI00248F8E3B|nr:PLP-dependent aminotransferase family protein [Serinicoccus marinus]